ncbi:MAG: hypothetical protein R3D98_17735 [Candidatus Krumholzibacteriia bacterium]
MLLKLLFLFLAYWVARLALRAFLPARPRPQPRGGARTPPRGPQASAPEGTMRDLTQQEISDADFEEIPPEE